MKSLYTLILFTLSISLFSQRGKDGIVTISSLNTIVNAYTSVTADANAGSTTINVANSAGLNPGDLVMIIQMQGARVNAQWDTVWVDPNNSMSVPNSNNIDYGSITDYRNTGNNEFAEINSIPNSTSIVVNCGLKNSYTYSYTNHQGGSNTMYGKIQVIKVPRYSSLIVNAGGSITCPQWDGAVGGVAVVEIENNTTLNNTPSFNVSGRGFRGGIKDNASSVFGGNKWGAINRDQGGYKGESIFGDTTTCKPFAALIGRGAIANGGGGGDAHNAGGGGGANGGNIAAYNGYGNPVTGYNASWNLEGGSFATSTSSGGGRGGYTFSNSNRNATTVAPGLISTTSNTWGGDNRRNAGGLGGRPLDYSTGRLYLGGGGGAGDGNENQAGAGGNGGGMVYVVCYGNLTGSGTIVADGASGLNTTPGCGSNDGGGGGGGGGTIVLKVNGTIGLTASPALSAMGGNGGNVVFNCVTTNYDGYGPGGSGGGGYISSTGTLPANTVAGGNNGIQTGNGTLSSTSIASAFPPNGATRGGSGTTGSISAYTLTPSSNQTVCVNQTFTVSATSTEPTTTINWYNSLTGGSSIATGNTYSAPAYTIAGTYTLFAGACSGTYRQPIVITVGNGVSIPITGNTSICSGNSTILSASGATNYTWSPGGQTTSTISVSPANTTTYTIIGASGTCTGTTSAIVSVATTPTISSSPQTICAGQVATFTVTGASTYTWVPGNITGSSYTTSPSSSGTISVIGANGTCSTQITTSVTVTQNPTLTVANQTICTSQSTTLSAGGATTYLWNTGATSNSISVSPSTTTIYTVTGTTNLCSTSNTVGVTVASQPTVIVNNANICSGSSVVLTASGANNYTWSPGGLTTSTISVNPTINTTYTVIGTIGTCSDFANSIVNVTSTPTLIANSVTVCTGQTATLSASGATNYTWSPGNIFGDTYTLTPVSNTTVNLIGANGTCTTQTNVSITIGTAMSLSVNSPTICSGETTTLVVNGASSYTWSTSSNSPTITVNPNNTTVYSVNGSNGLCNGAATATVFVNSVPTLTATATHICNGQTATVFVTGASTYTWSNNSNAATQTVSPTSTTVYTVSGTNTSGCTNTIVTTVTVNVSATPTISVNSATICNGQAATLNANGANSYTWSTNQNSATINPNPTTTTSYTVVGENNGCYSSASATVIVDPTTLTTYSSSENICPGDAVNLFATGTNSAITTYTWSNGVNAYSQTVNPTTNTTYIVNGTSIGGCPSISATVVVNVNPITADFTGITNTQVNVGETLTLTNISTGANNIAWTYCTGMSTDNTINITLVDTGSCCITLLASNATCTNSATKCVNVFKEAVISIPNVFTPNGDGKNEFFKINSTGLKNLNCVIFDRWGLKVYEWDGINGYWDGNTKSGMASDGTYFYVINYTDQLDKSTTEKGFVNLFSK